MLKMCALQMFVLLLLSNFRYESVDYLIKATYTEVDRKMSCSSSGSSSSCSSGGGGGSSGDRGRVGRGCCSCRSGRSGRVTIAGDRHVISLCTAVTAPRSVRTLIETRLTSSTLNVVQPDPSRTSHVYVAQHMTHVSSMQFMCNGL